MYRSGFNSISRDGERVDYATLIGIGCAFGLVFLAISLGDGFATFFNLKSFLIVIGGTLGGTLISYPLNDFARSLAVLRTTIFPEESSATQRVRKLISFAQRARTDGVLALQEDIYRESDPFVKKSLELAADGMETEDLRHILEMEIAILGDRHKRGSEIFQTMGTIAPAMGLIGTLIGLVQMLQNLENPTAIGPAMAVALLTTFYGAILAHLVFLPLAGKLRARSAEESLVKGMTVEGVVAISKGINPRLIEQQLLSFLPPEERHSQYGR